MTDTTPATAAHPWQPPHSAGSDLCGAMVMRDGGGDECGLPRIHPAHLPRTVDPGDMTVLAWVGPDEFDSTRGIKSAVTPVGWIPLAFKGEHEDRARDSRLRAELQNLANEYDIRVQLVRFKYAEIVETLEPGN